MTAAEKPIHSGKNLALALAMGLCVAASAGRAAQEIGWPDLTYPIEPTADPYYGLEFEQRLDLQDVLELRRLAEEGEKLTPQDRKIEEAARMSLSEAGLDPDALIAKERGFLEALERQSAFVRTDLSGQDVRIPGYVIPLEYSGQKVTEFLLVPYVGACIHVPPPPANQIIHVNAEPGIEVSGLFTPVWVDGELGISGEERQVQLSDGEAGFAVGYSLLADSVEPYGN